MIRVVYEWKVESDNIQAFQKAWRETTSRIHDAVKGARGSFMIQEAGSPGNILTIARWDCVEDWKAFWKEDNPAEMQGMRNLGERICVTVYDEVGDYTV